jgi:hypothetical protein
LRGWAGGGREQEERDGDSDQSVHNVLTEHESGSV